MFNYCTISDVKKVIGSIDDYTQEDNDLIMDMDSKLQYYITQATVEMNHTLNARFDVSQIIESDIPLMIRDMTKYKAALAFQTAIFGLNTNNKDAIKMTESKIQYYNNLIGKGIILDNAGVPLVTRNDMNVAVSNVPIPFKEFYKNGSRRVS